MPDVRGWVLMALMGPVGIAIGADAAPAASGEAAVTLAPGEGRERVVAHCSMCHSLDYIPMNSVFLDRTGWEASINKMIKVMGAPLRAEDVGPIVDYLTRHYGK